MTESSIPASTSNLSDNKTRWALTGLALSMLMPSLDASIANVGLPTLAQAFGASFPQVQWIVLAYLLVITSLIVSAGRLGDRVGRRRLLLVGIVVFSAASLLCALAPTLWMLIAARAAQGLGAAIMLALTMALVGDAVPKARTGSAMGLLGSMSAFGTTLGPSLGGVLIGHFGWPSIFLVNLPLGLACFWLAYRFLPVDNLAPVRQRPGFDWLGTLVLALTLTAFALSMTLGSHNGPLLGLAVCGAGLFIWVESSVAAPLLRLAMFRERSLSGGLAMTLLVATVIATTMVVGPFYLAHSLGLATAAVGLTLSVGPLTAVCVGVPAGRLVDRFGSPFMTTLGLLGMALGCGALALLPKTFGVAGYVLPIMLLTAGYALFQAANNTRIMSGVRADQRGVISATLSLSRNLGLISGVSVMGAVFSAASRTTDISRAGAEAIAHGTSGTFAVAAGLILLAIAIAWLSNQRKRSTS
jgi:MFS family permease